MLSFEQARQEVITQVSEHKSLTLTVEITLPDALGYVLAREVTADRDYPPFDRATRDGYAVLAADSIENAALRCVGEIKAGDTVTTALAPGTCIQIMTGAAVPPGADAVVMIEHIQRTGDTIHFQRTATRGQNIVPRRSEASNSQTLLQAGTRLGFAELGMAAQVGVTRLSCAKKPRIAILSTGDEIVPVDATPGPFQIRNSNSVSLGAQVRIAGGEPVLLGNAADNIDDLRKNILRGLDEDALVLSGGVSMGKYDLVEGVLRDLKMEFYFDAVAIRPGKPAVFGICRGKPVFGLPGNPVSTMVTFELFVVPAIDLLSGAAPRPLPLLQATLAEPAVEKPGMTHFLPAKVDWQSGKAMVRPLRWQGSGDTATMAKANCFLVVAAETESLSANESVNVLMRRDVV
ncbi:MAG: molybdopterin molybdotransferase MoeA [Acidobacteriota bacterium]|nr:molybdopterin molybdotransferase MoeA [Acidobacteriota bacterium]